MKALVVFADNEPPRAGDGVAAFLLHWALRACLAPGFRHCWLVLPDADGLTVIDPRASGLAVQRLKGHAYLNDLALMEGLGLARLVPVSPPADAAAWSGLRFGYFSCTGAVENILRLKRSRGLSRTPRMLWRFLTNCQEAHHGRQTGGAG
ncbi:hypothetical protein [Ferrovibrio sp.]|uniref:hypothetical protein n=1 Tax=Ferrovibrio sp. TaxID=1917215 RepID=UPI003D1502CB